MSEHRKATYGVQLQHGSVGSKIARIETYRARLWWGRPSFRKIYPNEVWDGLFRIRVDGHWWWLKSQRGDRFPFYTHSETWRLLSAYTAEKAGIAALTEPVFLPAYHKGDEVIAHVEGLRTKTRIKAAPWLDMSVCWVEVVGISGTVPSNAIWPWCPDLSTVCHNSFAGS